MTCVHCTCHGKQGWCSGESARLPPVWPGSDSRTRRHMWVEFVVGSLLAPRGFSPGTPVSPFPQKPTFPNSNSIWNLGTGNGRRRTTGCATNKSVFMYFLCFFLLNLVPRVFAPYCVGFNACFFFKILLWCLR